MPPLVPPADIHPPRSGDGRGGVHPPEIGGGGGRDPGDGSPDYKRRLQRARVGLICGVVSVTMLFAVLTTVFFTRQNSVVLDSHAHYVRMWVPVVLPVRLLLWNTLLLLFSSITLELARRRLARDMVLAPLRTIVGNEDEQRLRIPWLAITTVLGILFLLGQWLAWQEFRAHGFHAFTEGPSPFFYLLTGTHAVHLTVGVLVLLYAAGLALFGRALEERRIVLEVARWYWHFMGVLWLYVFALLWFVR
jgi:cytochrome c oxidase subunit III